MNLEESNGPELAIVDNEAKDRIMEERGKIIKHITEMGVQQPPSPTTAYMRDIEQGDHLAERDYQEKKARIAQAIQQNREFITTSSEEDSDGSG